MILAENTGNLLRWWLKVKKLPQLGQLMKYKMILLQKALFLKKASGKYGGK